MFQPDPAQTTFLPAVSPTGMPAPAVVPKTVPQLLKEFSKLPGCESYKNDGDRIKLLTTYLWLRQLTPALSFETFLSLFAPLANYDEENRKHPEDALRFHCPRSAKGASGGYQWSAKEVVEFATLYVDAIREAEAKQEPVSFNFDGFLQALKPQFLAGAFKEAEPPSEERKPRAAKGPATAVAVLPTAVGQRVLYTMADANGRQIRGRVQAMRADADRQYVTVLADGGELFPDVNSQHCTVINDVPPPQPTLANGAPKPELGRQRLVIAKSQYGQVRQALAMTMPMGNVPIGEVIYPFAVVFEQGLEAAIEVINGESRPFVDARLLQPGNGAVLCELPPRNAIEGLYPFELADGTFLVEVSGRE